MSSCKYPGWDLDGSRVVLGFSPPSHASIGRAPGASSESAPAASARAEAPGNGPRSATARPVAGSGSGWIWSKKILGMSVKI